MLPYSSVKVKLVEVDDKKLLGIEIDLPNAPPLILLKGDNGFIMCGYLDISVTEKIGVVAARVTGVKSVEEMLNREIFEATSKAVEKGIKKGVKVKDIIKYL